MKYAKKITAVVLTVLMIISIMPVSVFAAKANTPKEEVVYIKLNADGSVKEIYVVNIFDLDENGKIVDYGKYSELRNMTTTDSIEYNNNTVTIDTTAGKLYYEGKLEENVMPWKICIRYFMDGSEYSAKEIAGRSGKAEIKISITRNEKCNSAFFEGYALQMAVTLDTGKVSNIKADGATVANVGSNKQLSYIILPNTEKEITISADVREFEMNAVAINGIRMNLELEIDDSVIRSRIDEISGAVNKLNDGAGSLKSGANDLHAATEKLNAAMGDLHGGVGSLYSGSGELKDGIDILVSQNSALKVAAWTAYEGLCTAAETQLNAQLSANGFPTVKLTPATYSEVLSGVLKQMDADYAYNKAYNAALAKVSALVQSQADTLYAGYIESQADSLYSAYVRSQADTIYTDVVTKAVFEQLTATGMTDQQAKAYLQTPQGEMLVRNAKANLTKSQKEQIINAAIASLKPEQKEQILNGALASLTEQQKEDIRNGYIQQMMASDEVTGQINDAVGKAGTAAEEVAALKDQLDNYGAFYKGLEQYTNGAASAAGGAEQLKEGLSTLYNSTESLRNSVGELHIAVGTLKDGADKLKDGTQKFADKIADVGEGISREIKSMLSAIIGKNVETVSFASENNTNIKSVQFVIQTEAIEIDLPPVVKLDKEEHLNFWQKLLRLFGLY